MSSAGYHIIVITVAVIAVFKGFRTGFVGQVAGILGFAFGVVAARVFSPAVSVMVCDMMPSLRSAFAGSFISSVIATSAVYTAVYLAFRCLTSAIHTAMEVLHVGLLNSILGSLFCMLKYMMAVSLAFNLLLCINPESRLVRDSDADDGNVVQAVVHLAPALLGSLSASDLSHLIQLREAKKISDSNLNRSGGVIHLYGRVAPTQDGAISYIFFNHA